MTPFKTSAALLSLMAALCAPMAAQAHRGWILPSSTVLSGNDTWVGFDAAASEGVFEADHAPMRLDSLIVSAPDGSHPAPEHMMVAQYRATFDVHLTQAGTWKIANVSSGVNATWMLNGVPGRWRGPAADLAANVPAGATDVVSAPNANRLETFVTLGAPTTTVFTPTGQGIEMVPITHPNDLVVDEPATFQLLKDGTPLANADVTVARGGMRYRDAPEEMALKTDADGKVTVTWPEPGMYWLNTVVRPEGAPPRMEGGAGMAGMAGMDRGPNAGPGGEAGRGPGGPPVPMAQYTAILEVLP